MPARALTRSEVLKRIGILYTYRGQAERGQHYIWVDVYSATFYGPHKPGAVKNAGWNYGWDTKRVCQADARSVGARALFVDDGR